MTCASRRVVAATLLALLPVVVSPGCARGPDQDPEDRGGLALVLAPVGAAEPADPLRDPAPPGSRLVSWDPARPGEPPHPLLQGPVAAALCDVSPDGRWLLVTLQDVPGGPWRVHVLPAHGGEPDPVSPEGASAVAAAWMPGERVVFSCDLAGDRDGRDGRRALHLFTSNRDGSGLERISFSPFSDVDPVLLSDGRILFASWQPPGVGRPKGGFALFTMRNDGTGLAAWSGSHDEPADLWRPRRLGDEIVCRSELHGETGLALISPRRPLRDRRPLAERVPGEWRAGARGVQGGLLLCGRPPDADPAAPLGLFSVSADGPAPLSLSSSDPVPLLSLPGLDVFDVLPLATQPVPRGHLSSVDPQAETGELLCLDARRSEFPPSGRVAAATTLQILRPRERRGHAPAEASQPGGALESEVLASVPIGPDGSVWLTVPADTPLRFATLDAEGRLLLEPSSWVWVRPGERRACIGCHEDRESAPPNVSPLALAGEPIDVPAGRAGERLAQ